jgi:hypothetical protein
MRQPPVAAAVHTEIPKKSALMRFKDANPIIAASLSLSLAGFAPPIFAQNSPGTGDHSYRVAQAAGSSESSEADENNPQAEDRELSQKIDEARSAGKNVSSAEQHQKQGEQAIISRDNKAALHHFEHPEAALGENQENEEHQHGGSHD